MGFARTDAVSGTGRELGAALLDTARALGAGLAGIAAVEELRALAGPSHAEATRRLGDLPPAEPVRWPADARSVLVIAVEHPAERPELDWWFGRIDPPGNRVLARIVQGLCDWAASNLGMRTTHLPYHVERGGAYLKDAAVLAGLGCIGRNNLLITPELGSRVRLRALTLDASLPSTGPSDFDPCARCDAPCRRACPQGVFARPAVRRVSGEALPGAAPSAALRLPARTGEFSRDACYVQMERDIEGATLGDAAALGAPEWVGGTEPVKVIRYCRACELSCPVGTTGRRLEA